MASACRVARCHHARAKTPEERRVQRLARTPRPAGCHPVQCPYRSVEEDTGERMAEGVQRVAEGWQTSRCDRAHTVRTPPGSMAGVQA